MSINVKWIPFTTGSISSQKTENMLCSSWCPTLKCGNKEVYPCLVLLDTVGFSTVAFQDGTVTENSEPNWWPRGKERTDWDTQFRQSKNKSTITADLMMKWKQQHHQHKQRVESFTIVELAWCWKNGIPDRLQPCTTPHWTLKESLQYVLNVPVWDPDLSSPDWAQRSVKKSGEVQNISN